MSRTSNDTIEMAPKIIHILREHIEKESCEHCASLFDEVFE
jgi:hypothetical protein